MFIKMIMIEFNVQHILTLVLFMFVYNIIYTLYVENDYVFS